MLKKIRSHKEPVFEKNNSGKLVLRKNCANNEIVKFNINNGGIKLANKLKKFKKLSKSQKTFKSKKLLKNGNLSKINAKKIRLSF